MIAGSGLQNKELFLWISENERHNVYLTYCGIHNKLCSMLLTYHFIKAYFTQLSSAVKAPHGLCLV